MEDELMHYGVKGMKWGVRRARKRGTTYSYTSHPTKKYQKKALTNSKYAKRAKRYADVDAAYQKKALGQSRGKSVAKLLLMGPFGRKTYDIGRAAGYSRIASYGTMAVSGLLTGPFGDMTARYLFRNDTLRG